MLHDLDGEAVLYDPRSGAVHRFNAATLTVWNACDGSTGLSGMTETVAARFDLSTKSARVDVEEVIRELARHDLLLGAHDVKPRVGGESATEPAKNRFASRNPTRREVLSGGAKTLLVAAPLISTFFASGAYASGPSASGAWGSGCKEVGYSCSINGDCCQNPTKTKCQNSGPQAGTCCIQHLESPCEFDTQCCNAGDICVATVCQ